MHHLRKNASWQMPWSTDRCMGIYQQPEKKFGVFTIWVQIFPNEIFGGSWLNHDFPSNTCFHCANSYGKSIGRNTVSRWWFYFCQRDWPDVSGIHFWNLTFSILYPILNYLIAKTIMWSVPGTTNYLFKENQEQFSNGFLPVLRQGKIKFCLI